MEILDWVEERFDKAPTADKIQQEFYLLGQEKIKKIQQFASHLVQTYKKLQTKFPSHYDRKQLKDRLFLACISIYTIPCISTINKKVQHMKICYLLLERQIQNGPKVRSLLESRV